MSDSSHIHSGLSINSLAEPKPLLPISVTKNKRLPFLWPSVAFIVPQHTGEQLRLETKGQIRYCTQAYPLIIAM